MKKGICVAQVPFLLSLSATLLSGNKKQRLFGLCFFTGFFFFSGFTNLALFFRLFDRQLHGDRGDHEPQAEIALIFGSGNVVEGEAGRGGDVVFAARTTSDALARRSVAMTSAPSSRFTPCTVAVRPLT